MASWIVRHTGEFTEKVLADGRAVKVNPVGYQNVLYVTIALYIVAMIVCWTMVGKPHKEEE